MKEGMKKVDQHANTSEKVASCPARDKCKKLEMIKKKKKKKKNGELDNDSSDISIINLICLVQHQDFCNQDDKHLR